MSAKRSSPRLRWRKVPKASARARQRQLTQRTNPAVARALRAASEREPLLPPGFVLWAVGRLLAIALLASAAWLLYACASSDQFRVRSVRVTGNVLLSQAEVQDAAAVIGANVFWVDRANVLAQVSALPIVQHVEVAATLPDSVEIHVVERQPAAFWTSGDQSYLVDREGVILKPVDAETAQVRACAGQPCDPRLAALPSVSQVAGQPLVAGERVDAGALAMSARLASVLPNVGIVPVSFNWSADTGLEVPTRDGWRARFDQAGNIDQQIAMLRSIRDELARTRTGVELIDVRFGDRPYFR
jgi:POTRA domain, FtsQ-type/Cell division protein FtsQ